MSNIFLPDIFVDTVFDMNVEDLKAQGIKAFIFDIDNTLATYAMPIADEKTAAWVKDLRDKGFEIFIASNNDKERVRVFSENIGVPYFAKALKPLGIFLRRACKNMGVTTRETALVGDQLFTDVWGGNVLNMKTVLVKPISEVEDGFVKFKRRFERMILKNMRG